MEEKVRKHIFIVGDDRVFTQMLDYIFTKDVMYRFLDYSSGEDCIKNLHLKPEIIIIDYTLPGINGYDALLQIKESNPECYVIMLVDKEYRKMPSELLKAGASDYIIKNDRLVNEIVRKIEVFLEKEKTRNIPAISSSLTPVMKAVGFVLLIILLLSIGFYYYL